MTAQCQCGSDRTDPQSTSYKPTPTLRKPDFKFGLQKLQSVRSSGPGCGDDLLNTTNFVDLTGFSIWHSQKIERKRRHLSQPTLESSRDRGRSPGFSFFRFLADQIRGLGEPGGCRHERVVLSAGCLSPGLGHVRPGALLKRLDHIVGSWGRGVLRGRRGRSLVSLE